MRTHTVAFVAPLAAVALATAACGVPTNAPERSTTSSHSGGGGMGGTSQHTPGHGTAVTVTPRPDAPAQDRNQYQPDCSEPNPRPACTDPNYGASDNPVENGDAVMPAPNGGGSTVPCECTICTNPIHGAGTDPGENGGDESVSKSAQLRDDVPGGKLCITGGGHPGTYSWSDDTSQWVCQIG